LSGDKLSLEGPAEEEDEDILKVLLAHGTYSNYM
jgi:hypothetical protein